MNTMLACRPSQPERWAPAAPMCFRDAPWRIRHNRGRHLQAGCTRSAPSPSVSVLIKPSSTNNPGHSLATAAAMQAVSQLSRPAALALSAKRGYAQFQAPQPQRLVARRATRVATVAAEGESVSGAAPLGSITGVVGMGGGQAVDGGTPACAATGWGVAALCRRCPGRPARAAAPLSHARSLRGAHRGAGSQRGGHPRHQGILRGQGRQCDQAL